MSASSNEEALAAAKAEARKSAAKARAAAHKETAGLAADNLASGGLGFLGDMGPVTVSGFFPYKSEIDLLGLLGRLKGEGWTTCLPIVLGAGQPLVFKAWAPGEPTEPGAWDIPIPRASAQSVEPDVMLVPLLAFDREGYRLGYGGGYYDRIFAQVNCHKIGIGFEAQEAEKIPTENHDIKLDMIVTECNIHR